MLRAIADVLRKNGDELAMIDAADCGNPYAEMVRDAQMGAAQLDFYAGLVTEMKGASIPMGPDAVNFSVGEAFCEEERIIPFNHPFMFVAGKSAAPLAAGNTIVVKPPEQAPLSSLRLAELIDGILPPGVWNLVPGGKEVGQMLASHPDVAKVALIGTLPMSATLATSGWLASIWPTSLPPGTRFHTPGGRMPSMSSARRSEDSGACSGGFTTIVLPAASGAADLPATNIKGWLNGMMRPTTPKGSRTEKFTASGPIGIEAPFISVATP